MLVLLPPSETKRTGGDGAVLELSSLSFPALTPARRTLLAAVRALSRNRAATVAALHLGTSQAGEVDTNRVIRSSPTMHVLERYTGVLFDALEAPGLGAAERVFAAEHVAVQSALFGVVGAFDLIPRYRLAFDSRLPGMPLRPFWAPRVTELLRERNDFVVDLRSEGYVNLGPVPAEVDSVYVRILMRDPSGNVRPLNHFNKQAKGLFARAIIASGVDHQNRASFSAWAQSAGFEVSPKGRELELIVARIEGDPGKLNAALR